MILLNFYCIQCILVKEYAQSRLVGLTGHDVVKLLLRYQTVVVSIRLLNHLLQLLLINVLSQVTNHPLQVFH